MIRSFIDRQTAVTGFNPWVFYRSLKAVPSYVSDWLRYRQLKPPPTFRLQLRNAFPILTDRDASAGLASGHYFHQDLWASRLIFQRRPELHIDIGSRVDGFVAHLLTFMPVTIIDIRPLVSNIEGLTVLQDDATNLSKLEAKSICSLSSLHAAEHFGLGRYTDPIDPEACFKFMKSLQRVLAPGGRLYFSVPIGRERVEFNAHRVFDPNTVLRQFLDLQLLSFSYIGDDSALYQDTTPSLMPKSYLACGLFEFTRP
jgi:SAM-dependent methyltransferase